MNVLHLLVGGLLQLHWLVHLLLVTPKHTEPVNMWQHKRDTSGSDMTFNGEKMLAHTWGPRATNPVLMGMTHTRGIDTHSLPSTPYHTGLTNSLLSCFPQNYKTPHFQITGVRHHWSVVSYEKEDYKLVCVLCGWKGMCVNTSSVMLC